MNTSRDFEVRIESWEPAVDGISCRTARVLFVGWRHVSDGLHSVADGPICIDSSSSSSTTQHQRNECAGAGQH